MTRFKFSFLSIFAIALMLVSCGKTVDESLVLTEYLESAESPIDVASIAKYITASDLQTLVATNAAYIIDIRSAADYGNGHISGAVNVAEGDVISHLDGVTNLADYSKIVIACYTGQTAGFVTSLVNMAGYDAYSLKWGMSGWNAACDKITANSLNTYATQLETTANDKGAEGALPVLSTTMETGADILAARISTVADEGFAAAAVTATDVWSNLADYYIVNYWSVDHYNLGHITGAIQYTPNEDLMLSSFLKTLPAEGKIAVYCYTGQTSAFMAAYLRVLGYDAYSIKFGMNGMATDWAATNSLTHWSTDYIAGYELVTD